jgi:peptidoglycan hydrolase CwlO-like protein
MLLPMVLQAERDALARTRADLERENAEQETVNEGLARDMVDKDAQLSSLTAAQQELRGFAKELAASKLAVQDELDALCMDRDKCAPDSIYLQQACFQQHETAHERPRLFSVE